jgi:outer membrane biogenesis lipoprotein LolB
MSRSDRPLRRAVAVVAIGCAAVLGAGCAVAPTVAPAPRSGAADAVRDWAGRFSVTLQSDLPGGRQDAALGRFELASRAVAGGRRLELELTSPFGQILASGRREPDGASTLRLSDGRTLSAGSLDAVLERALGWQLPIERLPEWLDDRFETVLSRDDRGQVTAARDSGWQIERDARRWALQRRHADGQLRVVLVLDR